MKKPIPIDDVLDYVSFRREEDKYIPKEKAKEFHNTCFKIVSEALLETLGKVSGKLRDEVSRGSGQHVLVEMLSKAFEEAFYEAARKIEKLGENDWGMARAAAASAAALRGEEPPPEDDFTWLALAAKHGNEIEYRQAMQHEIIGILKSGKPLPNAARLWLAYVIERVQIPHDGKHAPLRRRTREARRYYLAEFIVEDEKAHMRSTTTARLKRATKQLHVSYETARASYYAKDFKWMLDYLRKKQDV
ncbi:MAG: hypothetical protein Q8L89_00950 [Gammaproteobacteria bacterium]|nr:hypothetical protein [Gammaproteobacteria bacterium]